MSTVVFLNGQFVPEDEAKVSVFDRGFLYGDGLFETLRIHRGEPFCWQEHFDRLRRGASFLGIRLPIEEGELRILALRLIQQNRMPESLLRITLSRGAGVRGYSPAGADRPSVVMTLHPAPDTVGHPPPKWRVITASFHLPANETLAQFKTCNKLPQILARAEADAAGADEALLLNTSGEVVEGAGSNLFWIRENIVVTPPLAGGILAGVTRLVTLQLCQMLGLPTREAGITPAELQTVQGVFLSLSLWGVVEVVSLDHRDLSRSPLVEKLQHAYARKLTGHDVRPVSGSG